MNRKNFISTLGTATAASIVGVSAAKGNTIGSPIPSSSLNMAPVTHKVKRGVALYSYQQTMMLNGMTLEDSIRELSDIGAYGLEAIGQVVVKDYPYPTDKWVGEWFDLMDKYGVIPGTYTNFHDKYIRKKPKPFDEQMEYQIREFKLGKKLGFKKYRMLIGTPVPHSRSINSNCRKNGYLDGT